MPSSSVLHQTCAMAFAGEVPGLVQQLRQRWRAQQQPPRQGGPVGWAHAHAAGEPWTRTQLLQDPEEDTYVSNTALQQGASMRRVQWQDDIYTQDDDQHVLERMALLRQLQRDQFQEAGAPAQQRDATKSPGFTR